MNDVMTSEEVKRCLFDILVKFAEYCDAHGLKYVLSSGTLLGAIRHKGFIPWDDDIDVDMPREDYEKFCRLSQDEPLGDNLRVKSLSLNNATFPFAKVVDVNTSVIGSHSDANANLWIDIFPVDGFTQEMADNYDKLNKKIWKGIIYASKASNKLSELKSPLEKLKTIYARLFGSAEKQGRRLDSFAKSHKLSESPYAADVVWGGQRAYMPSGNYFENRVPVEFEGKTFWAMHDWDTYLTKMYGDYMKLPPENERDTHGITARYINK